MLADKLLRVTAVLLRSRFVVAGDVALKKLEGTCLVSFVLRPCNNVTSRKHAVCAQTRVWGQLEVPKRASTGFTHTQFTRDPITACYAAASQAPTKALEQHAAKFWVAPCALGLQQLQELAWRGWATAQYKPKDSQQQQQTQERRSWLLLSNSAVAAVAAEHKALS